VEDAAERLAILTEKARQNDYRLLLENEKGIVTDTPERSHAVLSAINSPNLRFIWDPANFVQVGVAQQSDKYWNLLSPDTSYIHIKDAMLAEGKVKPAGQGDGQVPELLAKLKAADYSGMLALEPHLAIAGHSGGFSGVDGMTLAVKSLRAVMAQVGMEEG
jgi:sugar phosphate isomerase/epimerase